MIAIEDIKSTYGVETAAIILCCRVFFNTADYKEIESYINSNDINWDELLTLARVHRIRPVVFKVISSTTIPADVSVIVQSKYSEIIVNNWRYAIETERIILLLKRYGIEAIPYKGTVFSLQFFGDMVSRESTDIDLFIKPTDLGLAIDVLKKDGFLAELDDMYQYLGDRYVSYSYEYSLDKFENGQRIYHVELHWAVIENVLAENTGIQNLLAHDKTDLKYVDNVIYALDTHTHFTAILIHHSIKDTFRSLKNILDLSQAFLHPQIIHNIKVINKNLEETHFKKAFSVANSLSFQLFGIKLGDTQGKATLVNRFLNKLLNAKNIENNSIYSNHRFLLQDSFLYKLRFCWLRIKARIIPMPIEFRGIKLPRLLFFVHYIIKFSKSLLNPVSARGNQKKSISVTVEDNKTVNA